MQTKKNVKIRNFAAVVWKSFAGDLIHLSFFQYNGSNKKNLCRFLNRCIVTTKGPVSLH